MTRRRLTGDTVVWRSLAYGHVRFAMPHTLVEERSDPVVLWLPERTCGRKSRGPALSEAHDLSQLGWSLQNARWRNSWLKLWRPGRAHSLWLFWRDGAFAGWYVNLEEPWRRTAVGWDSRDQALDVVVDPDGSWSWKDEDHLAAATARGHYTRKQAAAVLAEGEAVLAERPWLTGWEDRRPDPAWATRQLPPGWDDV